MATSRSPEPDEPMPAGLASIAIFFLGGTIGMTGADDGATVRLGGDSLVHDAGLDAGPLNLEVSDFRAVPSASLTLDDILELHERIEATRADGVVVVQGTDTIEETAYLLDLLWSSDVPLVVTGAMRNPSLPSPDGPGNLVAATAVAASPDFRGLGALVVLADEVHAARHVRKTHSTSVTAFTSPDAGPLGLLVEGRPVRVGSVPRRGVLRPRRPVSIEVGLLTVTLGDEPHAVERASAGCAGLVVAGFGVGHVPAPVAEPLGELSRRIPVVLASRTHGGPVLRRTYGAPGSERDLIARGLVPAGLLDPFKARILLLASLASGHGADEVRTVFGEHAGIALDAS